MAANDPQESTKLASLPEAPVETGGGVLTRWEHNFLLQQARAAKAQGLLPPAVTAEQGYLIMCRGRELGIPPLASLSQIYIVDNKPAIMGKAKLAKVRESGRYGFRFDPVPDPKTEARFTIWPYGHEDEKYTAHWTLADAKARGITTTSKGPKHNWTAYPDFMLRWRAASEGMDAVAPEVCLIPTVEELADDFTLEGDKLVLPPPPAGTIVPQVRECTEESTGYRMAAEVESAARAQMRELDWLPDDIEATLAQVGSDEDARELAAMLKEQREDMVGGAEPAAPQRLIEDGEEPQ